MAEAIHCRLDGGCSLEPRTHPKKHRCNRTKSLLWSGTLGLFFGRPCTSGRDLNGDRAWELPDIPPLSGYQPHSARLPVGSVSEDAYRVGPSDSLNRWIHSVPLAILYCDGVFHLCLSRNSPMPDLARPSIRYRCR